MIWRTVRKARSCSKQKVRPIDGPAAARARSRALVFPVQRAAAAPADPRHRLRVGLGRPGRSHRSSSSGGPSRRSTRPAAGWCMTPSGTKARTFRPGSHGGQNGWSIAWASITSATSSSSTCTIAGPMKSGASWLGSASQATAPSRIRGDRRRAGPPRAIERPPVTLPRRHPGDRRRVGALEGAHGSQMAQAHAEQRSPMPGSRNFGNPCRTCRLSVKPTSGRHKSTRSEILASYRAGVRIGCGVVALLARPSVAILLIPPRRNGRSPSWRGREPVCRGRFRSWT